LIDSAEYVNYTPHALTGTTQNSRATLLSFVDDDVVNGLSLLVRAGARGGARLSIGGYDGPLGDGVAAGDLHGGDGFAITVALGAERAFPIRSLVRVLFPVVLIPLASVVRFAGRIDTLPLRHDPITVGLVG